MGYVEHQCPVESPAIETKLDVGPRAPRGKNQGSRPPFTQNQPGFM